MEPVDVFIMIGLTFAEFHRHIESMRSGEFVDVCECTGELILSGANIRHFIEPGGLLHYLHLIAITTATYIWTPS